MLCRRPSARLTMLFSSTVFLFVFLPLVLALYYAFGRRARNVVLLVASLVFYAWGEELMVGLMLLSILVNYGLGRWVDSAKRSGGARHVIAVAVVFNIGLLMLFKYSDWLWESAWHLAGEADPAPLGTTLFQSDALRAVLLTPSGHIRLPIGISFFTFHALSYVIDVYRGDGEVQRRPVDFALYISQFPQLIAGPIVRYRDVSVQLHDRTTSVSKFASGVRRFVMGLGKKVLIANVAGATADQIFASPTEEVTMAVAWLAVFAYWAQIYFDFSGYSDMAIGLGRMFGFEFRENFNYPYISRSLTEFWRRWHISLSTWFRDYLYIPMGGNRGSVARTYFNLITVFFLCGLWHGAQWNFVLFGLFQGAVLVVERMGLLSWLERWPRFLQHAYLQLVVAVSWVFFRVEQWDLARSWFAAMFGFHSGAPQLSYPALYLDSVRVLVLCAGVIGAMPWVPAVCRWLARRREQGARPVFLAVAAHAALLAVFVLSAMELTAGTYNPFIYFRF
jgi:alginate O-acetyltransferase complex protein AlgI